MPSLVRTRHDTDQLAEVRERAQQVAEMAREASGPALDRAREVTEPARSQVLEVSGRILRIVMRVAAVLPGLAAKVLAGLASGLGRLADRTAVLGDAEPPSAPSRRRSRRRAVLWFTTGFATGAAAGFAVNDLLSRPEEDLFPAPERQWPAGVPSEPPDTGPSAARPADG